MIACVAVEAFAVNEFDRDLASPRGLDVVVQAVGGVGEDDAADGAASAERFADRVTAVQKVQSV